MANKVEIQIVGNNVYAVNAIDGTKKKLGQLKTAADQTQSTLSRMGKGLIAGLGAASVVSFMQSSIQAFRDQEVAVRKLDTALGRSSTGLQQYANEIQKTTTFADELTLEAMSLLAAFVKDEEQIKRLTKATTDLATAKGMDLVSAADLVAKSVGSSTNALSRYGIQVNGVVGSTERLESAIKNINALYGGQAEAVGKTLSGQMEILNNQLSDQQEVIGEGLLPVWVALNQVFAGFISLLQITDPNKPFRNLVEQMRAAEEEAKKLAGERFDTLSKTFNLIQNSAAPMIFLTEEQKKALEVAKKHREEEEKKLEALRKQNEEAEKARIIDELRKNRIEIPGDLSFGGVPLEMVQQYYDARAELSLEFTNQEIANWLLMQDVSVDIFGNMAGAALSFYDASGNAAKGWFGVYKAMAIAQTAIATYQAAVEAYKAMVGIPIVGPGLAIAAAAAATAFGLSNIARIASMQPGGGFGGGVPSAAPSLPAGNITNNNNQRSMNYSIVVYTSDPNLDKDRFARDIIGALRKAEDDGG